MRRHVSGQVMSLSEELVADGAGELLLPPPSHLGLSSEFLFVVGAHVEDQVRGHAEGKVAFGAPVLHGDAERGECGWEGGEGRCGLQLSSDIPGPVFRCVMESAGQRKRGRRGLQVTAQDAGCHQVAVSHKSPGVKGFSHLLYATRGRCCSAAEMRLGVQGRSSFTGLTEGAFLFALSAVGQNQRERTAAAGVHGISAVRRHLFGFFISILTS